MADRKLEKILENKKRLEEKLRQKELQNQQKADAEYERKNAIAIEKIKQDGSLKKETVLATYQQPAVTISQIREALTKSHYFSSTQKRAEQEEIRLARIESELQLTASVTINVHYVTEFGESLHLTGSTLTLGKWATESALPMTWKEGHIWTIAIDHPKGVAEFRFFMKDDRSKKKREEDGEVHVAHFASQSKLTLNETWRTKANGKTPSPSSSSVVAVEKIEKEKTRNGNSKNTTSSGFSSNLKHLGQLNSSLDARRGASMNEDSYFSLLSDEIILNILKHLSVPNLLRVSCVCWALNEIAADVNLWRAHFLEADSVTKSKIDEKNVSDWRALAAHRIRFQRWEQNAKRVENQVTLTPCGSGKVFAKHFVPEYCAKTPHLITAVGSGSIRSWRIRNAKQQQRQPKEISRKVPTAMLWNDYFTPFDANEITSLAADKNVVVATDLNRFYFWNFQTGEYLKSKVIGSEVEWMDVRDGVIATSSNAESNKNVTCSLFRGDMSDVESLGKPIGCLQAIGVAASVAKHAPLQWKFFADTLVPPAAPTGTLVCATRRLQHFGTESDSSSNLLLLSASLSLFDLNRIASSAELAPAVFACTKPLRPYRAIFRNGNIIGGVHYRAKNKMAPNKKGDHASNEIVLELFDARNSSRKPILKRAGLSSESWNRSSNLVFDDVRCLSCVDGRALLWDLRINRPPVMLDARDTSYETFLLLNDHLLLPKWEKQERCVETVVCNLQTLGFPVVKNF